MPPIISVENLSKCYLVGHQSAQQERYTALRDVIGRHAKNFARKAFDMARGRQIVQGDEVEEFWALKDVSFEVNEGEVVGVIGRNGAGKSTLLKILSRITEPTSGRVTLRGRVASLLEVGTGFHPELTGRENIFLNGAILGMTRAEIKRKFDEIVAFAEVEKFLDTPVKRYSSGMYVRLAFAVAAHLDPEILVVDEVLAVGDAEFQKKCLGKMQDVAKGGRTVLFVSHSMSAVRTLCNHGVLMVSGKIVRYGAINEVADSYQTRIMSTRVLDCSRKGPCSLVSFEVVNNDGISTRVFFSNQEINIRMEFCVYERAPGLRSGFRLGRADGTVIACFTPEDECLKSPFEIGVHSICVTLPANCLLQGLHTIGAAIWCGSSGEIYINFPDLLEFEIEPAKDRAYRSELSRAGVFQCYSDWEIETLKKTIELTVEK